MATESREASSVIFNGADYHEICESSKAVLIARGAHMIGHGFRSLYHHLIGVENILSRWQQSPVLRLAGLFHSVYSTDAFRQALYSLEDRSHIQTLIGVNAERLVYLFCSVRKESIVSAARMFADFPFKDTYIDHRNGDSSPLCVTAMELSGLLAILVANAIEQTSANADVGFVWKLAQACNAITTIGLSPTPPLFRTPSHLVAEHLELAVTRDYLAVTSGMEVNDAHLVSLKDTSRAMPFIAEPQLLTAIYCLAKSEIRHAYRLLRSARSALMSWGAAWDKRLPLTSWLALCDALLAVLRLAPPERQFILDRLLQKVMFGANPTDLYAAFLNLGLLDEPVEKCNNKSVMSATSNCCNLPTRFAEYTQSLFSSPRRVQKYPNLQSPISFDKTQFPVVKLLEQQWPAIAAEYRALAEADFHNETEAIGRVGSWTVFMLQERLFRRDENCAKCPTLANIITDNNCVNAAYGLVYLSRLRPGSRIAPHRGPTNVRIRCHLAIDIPDHCGISVAGKVLNWKDGECLLLDDSQEHYAWNHGKRDRTVAVIDLWHPQLSAEEKQLLTGLETFGVRRSNAMDRYLNRNEKARNRVHEYSEF